MVISYRQEVEKKSDSVESTHRPSTTTTIPGIYNMELYSILLLLPLFFICKTACKTASIVSKDITTSKSSTYCTYRHPVSTTNSYNTRCHTYYTPITLTLTKMGVSYIPPATYICVYIYTVYFIYIYLFDSRSSSGRRLRTNE